ncbi:hypothetical protein Ocin01_14300, partial [Orchesella cincta]
LCVWKKEWAKTPLNYVNNGKDATVEFGYAGNKDARRSKFKQTFGNLACPDGYRMAREANKELFAKPAAGTAFYKYDYMETYWIVDKEEFNKTATSTCTKSVPSGAGYTRTLAKVPCTEWNFYLCEKLKKRVSPFEGELLQTPNDPSVKWNEARHERTYPILKAK